MKIQTYAVGRSEYNLVGAVNQYNRMIREKKVKIGWDNFIIILS